MFTSEQQAAAEAFLDKYPERPCRALIEALRDTNTAPEVSIAIILDPRCGLERRADYEDGGMKRPNGERIVTLKGDATPLILVTMANRVDVLRLLLAAGASVGATVDVEEFTALHLSAQNDISEVLMAYGADLDAKDYRGNPPCVLKLMS